MAEVTQFSVRDVFNTLPKLLPVKFVSKQSVTFGLRYLQDKDIMLVILELK